MNETFVIADLFGEFCADGERAAEFRVATLESLVSSGKSVFLDFQDVRGMNSSFSNALIATLIENQGSDAISRLRFLNCRELTKLHIRSSITLGLQLAEEAAARGPA